MTELERQLKDSAERFAQSAMESSAAEDHELFLFHAGVSLEHLVKAYLAHIDPSLIAEKDFDSLLHATGNGVHARRPVVKARTVSLGIALERCAQLLPSVAEYLQPLQLLIDVRNGVAHVGATSEGVETQVRIPFLKCTTLVLDELGVSGIDYWDEFDDVVDRLMAEDASEAQTRALAAVATATRNYRENYADYTTSEETSLARAIEHSYNEDKYDTAMVDCPGCSHLALASGQHSVEWKADYDYVDGEDLMVGAYPEVTLAVSEFACRICGLKLSGSEEIAAVKIGTSIVIEDVDIEDFVEHEGWDDI